MENKEDLPIYLNARLAFKLGGLIWMFVYALALVLAQLVNWWLGLAVFVAGDILGLSIGTLLFRSARLTLHLKPSVVVGANLPCFSQIVFAVAALLGYLLLWLLISRGQLIWAMLIAAVVLAVAWLIVDKVFNYLAHKK
jgi:hypothetical protein